MLLINRLCNNSGENKAQSIEADSCKKTKNEDALFLPIELLLIAMLLDDSLLTEIIKKFGDQEENH